MEIVKEATQSLANAYYQAVGNKDLPTIANLLHTNVRLIGPLGNAEGKESVLQAVTGFATLLRSLRVNVTVGSEDQAMVNYDLDFGDPFGTVRSVALITCKDNLIARIELFFDARPFAQSTTGSFRGRREFPLMSVACMPAYAGADGEKARRCAEASFRIREAGGYAHLNLAPFDRSDGRQPGDCDAIP